MFQACGLADEVLKNLKVNKGMKFVDKVILSKTKIGQLNIYRVTNLVGNNLPLTEFRRFWQLMGHF